MVLQVLLTLLIQGTADYFFASCRLAAKCSPACTFNVAGITAGRWGGLIGTCLLFEIISAHTVAGEKGGRREMKRKCDNDGTMYLQRTADKSRCWLDSPCRAME